MNQSPSDLLSRLIERALAAGADAADARLSEAATLGVEVRNGALEGVEREESRGVALRALVGRRQASVSGADLSSGALDALAERVAAMARLAPEDPWAGLAAPEELAQDPPAIDLDGDDRADAAELERRAVEAEAAALAVPEVKQTGHAGASWSVSTTHYAASNGFSAARSAGMTSIAVVAIAERAGAMERDHDSRSERRLAQMPSPRAIGAAAGERAARRLGSRKIQSRVAPVIFENRLANRLLGAFIGAISGPAVARGVSFLKDRLGKPVFAAGVQIVDDPLRPLGHGSRAFDGEGRPARATAVVDDGVLTCWLLNGPSARQLGLAPNGFASPGFGDPPGVSTSNLDLRPGSRSFADLMADAGEGLFVTDMFGPSLNANTGDYSVGVSGFWFSRGEIAFPVSEVTVAGDLPSMFLRAVPGADLERRGSVNAPSLLIDALSLAGR